MDRVTEVLAALRKEQQALLQELSRVERAIAALEEVLDPEAASRAVPGAIPLPPEPAPTPYAGLRFHEAAAAYLAAAGEPRTPREIADALVAGGFRTRSKNFTASVRTMLSRERGFHGVERTADGRGWFVQR